MSHKIIPYDKKALYDLLMISLPCFPEPIVQIVCEYYSPYLKLQETFRLSNRYILSAVTNEKYIYTITAHRNYPLQYFSVPPYSIEIFDHKKNSLFKSGDISCTPNNIQLYELKVYVLCDHWMYIFEASDLKLFKKFPIAHSTYGLHINKSDIYIGHINNDMISVYDTEGKIKREINLGKYNISAHNFDIDHKEGVIYISDLKRGKLASISIKGDNFTEIIVDSKNGVSYPNKIMVNNDFIYFIDHRYFRKCKKTGKIITEMRIQNRVDETNFDITDNRYYISHGPGLLSVYEYY